MPVKKVLLFVVLVVSVFYVRGVYSAQSVETPVGITLEQDKQLIALPPKDEVNPFFGQDHAYSVTFRGNGQAVVFLRVVFSNNGDTPLNELTLRFPKVEPEGILAYQVIKDKQCLKYDYDKPTVGESYQYPCLEYGESDYNYYGSNTYKKARTSFVTDTLTVELPNSTASQKTGSVLLYFRAFGFATKNAFGAYDYTFETLKVDDTVRSLLVGISPDSDLYMKGAQGNVNYYKESAAAFESTKTMSVGGSFRNSSVDSIMSNIGYGMVNKNASNLMPLDSYKVRGSYADSRLKLYAGTIVIVVIVVVAVLFALGFGVWKFFKTLNKKPTAPNALNIDKPHASYMGINLAISASAGFVSASIIVILVFLAYFVVQAANSWAMSPWMGVGEVASVLPVLAVLFFVGLIGLFMVFPCVFVGIRRGIWWGLATFVFTLFWLFMVFVVLGVVFFGFRSNYPTHSLPMM